MYKNGNDVKPDSAKVLVFYKKACEGNVSSACFESGLMYDTQYGRFHDNAKAIEYYQKSCEGDRPEPNAFLNIGVIYANGVGVERDIVKAKEYFQKACEVGSEKGCRYYRQIP